MLLLIILMDVPVQLILLAPILVWSFAPHEWRPAAIALGVIIWGGLATYVVRKMIRSEAEHRASSRPQGDWRWPASMNAETYERSCRLLLQNHGWRALQTLATDPYSITLRLQKDRACVLMRCRRGPAPPSRTGA